MRIDNSKDFDLQIRSMLENAEEKVPSGVWEAVCSSLGGSKRAMPAWKWAGAALALAASLAAGLFFTGTFDRSPATPAAQTVAEVVSEKIYVEEPAPLAEEAAVAAPQALLVAKAQPEVRSKVSGAVESAPAAEAVLVAESASAAVLVAESASAEPVQAESGDFTVSSEPIVSKPASDRAEEDQPTTDIFARMMLEDELAAASRRKVSLTVGGSMGTNDKDFTGVFGPKRSASSVVFDTKNKIVESGSSTFGVPFSAGIGVRIPLGGRFSIGTGINYSLLSRSFTGIYYNESGVSSGEVTIDNKMHYIGIPVNAYYDIVSLDKFKFYCYGGAEAEYCFKNVYDIHTGSGVTQTSKVSGIQFSAGAGLGVEYLFTDKFGLYFDPGVRYYFSADQPRSLRTEHPFNINFDLGLRFDF